MGVFERYLAEEIAVDHADGIIPRREAMRRLGMLGFSVAAAQAYRRVLDWFGRHLA